MTKKFKPNLSIDEQIDKCWYSRWIAINEDEYQCVILSLQEIIKTAKGQFYLEGKDKIANQAEKTLATFKRNQQHHYKSREEHRKLLKKEGN